MRRILRWVGILVVLGMLSATTVAWAGGGGVSAAPGPAPSPGVAPGGGTPEGGGAAPAGAGAGGAGGATPSWFLTPEQEHTWDTFKACATIGAELGELRPSGSFTFFAASQHDAQAVKACMARSGFTFSH